MYHKELKSIQTIQQKFWSLAEQQPHENVTATLKGRMNKLKSSSAGMKVWGTKREKECQRIASSRAITKFAKLINNVTVRSLLPSFDSLRRFMQQLPTDPGISGCPSPTYKLTVCMQSTHSILYNLNNTDYLQYPKYSINAAQIALYSIV